MLLFKNLLFTALVPGFIAGWVPLRLFERRARWPGAWGLEQGIGAILGLLGAVVFLHSVWVLAVRGQGTPLFFDPPKKLTKSGPYKWVRNPMYLAFCALVAGEALFFRSWHIGVYFVCLGCVLHLLVVLHEERELRFRTARSTKIINARSPAGFRANPSRCWKPRRRSACGGEGYHSSSAPCSFSQPRAFTQLGAWIATMFQNSGE